MQINFERIVLADYLLSLFKRGQFVFYTSFLDKIIFFLIFVIIARKYSIAEYGAIASLFVLGNILVSFFELGLSNYFQRRTASDLSKAIREFNHGITFRLITYFIIILISILFYYEEGFSKLPLVIIVITSLFIFNSSWLVIKVFYGLNQYKSVFSKFVISRCILLLCAFLLLFNDISITLFSVSFLISALVELILLIYLLKLEEAFSFRLELKLIALKGILISSVPMGLAVFFVVVYDRVDILLIQKIIGLEQVGIYAVAYSMYKIPHILIGIILTPLFTDLSKKFKRIHKINVDRIKIIGIGLALYGIISIIIYYFFSDFFVNLIYGHKYNASSGLLKVLVISLPFLFLNNLTGVTLNSTNNEKLAFLSTMIAALVNILINTILIIKIGLMGAVITTILTELLVFLFQVYFIQRNKIILIK